MLRNDISSPQCVILVIVIALAGLLILPRGINQEEVIDISDEEIQQYIKQDFEFVSQGSTKYKISNKWIGFQDSVSGLRSLIDNYQRLNLNHLLEVRENLKSEVEKCQNLDLASQLQALKDERQLKKSDIDKSFNQTQFDEIQYQKIQIKKNITDLEQQINYFTQKHKDTIKQNETLQNRMKNIEQEINKRQELTTYSENNITKITIKIQNTNLTISNLIQNNENDLSQYYQRDRELAQQMNQQINKESSIKQIDQQDYGGYKIINLFADTINYFSSCPGCSEGLSIDDSSQETQLKKQMEQLEYFKLELEVKQKEKHKYEQEISNFERENEHYKKEFTKEMKYLEHLRTQLNIKQNQKLELEAKLNMIEQKIGNFAKPDIAYDNELNKMQIKVNEFIEKSAEQDSYCYQICLDYQVVINQIKSIDSREQINGIVGQIDLINTKLTELDESLNY